MYLAAGFEGGDTFRQGWVTQEQSFEAVAPLGLGHHAVHYVADDAGRIAIID